METLTYEGSKQEFRSQLNIFELPPSDVSVASTTWLNITPSSSISDSFSPIIFNVPASHTQYYDLANSYMLVKVTKWIKICNIAYENETFNTYIYIYFHILKTIGKNSKQRFDPTPIG